MHASRTLPAFARDEDGAVTVDWVVLTAALVGLGILVISTIAPGVGAATCGISTALEGAGVAETGGDDPGDGGAPADC